MPKLIKLTDGAFAETLEEVCITVASRFEVGATEAFRLGRGYQQFFERVAVAPGLFA